MTPGGFDTSKAGLLIVQGKKYKAKKFHVGAQVIELYPIQVLGKAIKKSVQTIRLWERSGEFPKPLYRVTGIHLGSAKRWYSREQIINLYQAKNRFPYSAGRREFRESFFALVKAVFDEGEVIDVSTISVNPTKPAVKKHSDQPKSVSNRQVAEPAARRIAKVPRSGQAVRTTQSSYPRHAASNHRNAQKEKPDYRRRPSGNV